MEIFKWRLEESSPLASAAGSSHVELYVDRKTTKMTRALPILTMGIFAIASSGCAASALTISGPGPRGLSADPPITEKSRPTVPQAPADCFAQVNHRYYSQILEDGKTIRVTSFIRQSTSDWDSKEELFERFTNFENWGTYAADSGTGAVAFKTSLRLSDITVDGVTIMRHYSDYYVAAPIVTKLHIVELNYNKVVPAYEGADLSLEFDLAPSSVTDVPGIGPYKARGIKSLHGSFHITKRSSEGYYFITIVVDVLPEIDFGPKIAEPYVLNVGRSMVLGMFADGNL